MTTEFWTIIGVGISMLVFGLACLQLVFRRMDKGFDAVNNRFDDVNKRFDDVNKRIDDTNKRFDDTNKRIDQRFDAVNKRIDDTNGLINQRINDTNRRIDELSSDVKHLASRVTELEKGQVRMEGQLNNLRDSLFERSPESVGTSSD